MSPDTAAPTLLSVSHAALQLVSGTPGRAGALLSPHPLSSSAIFLLRLFTCHSGASRPTPLSGYEARARQHAALAAGSRDRERENQGGAAAHSTWSQVCLPPGPTELESSGLCCLSQPHSEGGWTAQGEGPGEGLSGLSWQLPSTERCCRVQRQASEEREGAGVGRRGCPQLLCTLCAPCGTHPWEAGGGWRRKCRVTRANQGDGMTPPGSGLPGEMRSPSQVWRCRPAIPAAGEAGAGGWQTGEHPGQLGQILSP